MIGTRAGSVWSSKINRGNCSDTVWAILSGWCWYRSGERTTVSDGSKSVLLIDYRSGERTTVSDGSKSVL
jgi:hypothetical protein